MPRLPRRCPKCDAPVDEVLMGKDRRVLVDPSTSVPHVCKERVA